MSKRKLESEEPPKNEADFTAPPHHIDKDEIFASLYKTEPDFRELARLDADFGAFVKNGSIDFTNPDAVMQLTKSLLAKDFGLELEMPPDRLCPMVHNRHNYILWLKELIDSTMPRGASQEDITGLDIGTGASCIYPLLGCVQRPWSFIGTDIDESNIENAKANIHRNALQSRIRVLLRALSDRLVSLDDLGVNRLTFTMTNPPFYESLQDLQASAALKSRPPLTACTGSAVEMVTAGGEVGFAQRILADSLLLREKVQWYTIMFGKHSSLEAFVEKLRHHAIDNYAVTEFVQGAHTRRVAVAWSFARWRPSAKACRGIRSAMWRRLLPASPEVQVFSAAAATVVAEKTAGLITAVKQAVDWLDLENREWDEKRAWARGDCKENVWCRAYRRRKQREGLGEAKDMDEKRKKKKDKEHDTSFGFSVWVSAGVAETTVTCRWIYGYDESTFTSFQGYIKAAVSAAWAAE